MSDSTCFTYSVSANNSPARKAPSARESPAAWVSTEVPSTTSSVVAANTSLFLRALMRRYSGRTTSRPPAVMPPMHSTAFTAATPRALLMVAKPTAAPSWGASRGMSISSTTTARSWNSSTLKAARPCRDPVSARSASTCMATAVEDRARPPPKMMAPGPCTAASPDTVAAISAVVTMTWRPPRPNTNLCMERRRSRDSSSPMLNSRNTTPSSARCLTPSTSLTMPRAWGPMRAPPARKPSTGEPPGSLHTAGTTTTLVSSSQMVSSSPCSCFRVSGMGSRPSAVFTSSCNLPR
mmetsp:Transcript_2577/g.7681  ORF Transcript_2577/g.7681 Transcript_2577/m.7681 type:complete len:294 (-) Transcript_2577:1468-2349(-)